MKTIEERLIELESTVAFQEVTIEELNTVLYEQQQEIQELFQKLKLVEGMVKNQQPTEKRTPEDERPPHY